MRASGSMACTMTKPLGEAKGRLNVRSICRVRTGLSAASISSAWKRPLKPT